MGLFLDPTGRITPLANARDSFIKGLKAYFSHRYSDDELNEFRNNMIPELFIKHRRSTEEEKKSLFLYKNALRFKDAVIFYHHAIEQLLKAYFKEREIPTDSNFYKIIWHEKLDLKSVRKYREQLALLNKYRNNIYHNEPEDPQNALGKLLGCEILFFFESFLEELGYSFRGFLPYESEVLNDLINKYTSKVENNFKPSFLGEEFFRVVIMAKMGWLEIAGENGILGAQQQKLLDFNHQLAKEQLEAYQECLCPVCSQEMLLEAVIIDEDGNDFNLDDAPADRLDAVFGGEGRCCYCGFRLEGDAYVDFFDSIGFEVDEILKNWLRKRNRLSEPDNE